MIKFIKKLIEKNSVDLFFLVNFNISEIEEKQKETETTGEIKTIKIEGVLTPTASIFGTGYNEISEQIKEANDDEKIKKIVLQINSPGGSVAGLQKVINEIKKSSKRVEANVDGLCASAAYWIAAATDFITVSEGSIVGSIGAMMLANKNDEGDFEKVVAKITNRKNAGVDEDRKQYQDIVDFETSRFLLDVARLRNFKTRNVEEIAALTGNGKIMHTQEARELGLIDKVEGVEFFEETKKEKNKEKKMEPKNENKEIVEQLKAQILQQERDRVAGLAVVFNLPTDFVEAVKNGKDVGTAAVSLLTKLREEAKQKEDEAKQEIKTETDKVEDDAEEVNNITIPTASMSVDIPSAEEIIQKIKNKE